MESSRAVLRTLALHGPETRPRLGERLSLSKPTMSAAVEELSDHGLVVPTGLAKGSTGRTAQSYGLGPQAGYIIGIDVGAEQVRVRAQTLDGELLAAAHGDIAATAAAEAIWETAQAVIRAIRPRQRLLRSIAVAVPRIVSARTLHRDGGPDAVLHLLRSKIPAPVLIENNVNCAAIAEMTHGAARGRDTFAYLQIGLRIGLGIVAEGRLYRGAGAAGEIGRLPFPWSASEQPTREGLEHYLGALALMDRCRQDWPEQEGPAPASARELFQRAEAGCRPALDHVVRHAGDIVRLAAGCIGVLDPGLIVLGGGVGQNPLMLEEVRRVATALCWPTEIAVTPLGEAGTVLGAVQLAADYGIGLLLQEERHPAVVLPPLRRR